VSINRFCIVQTGYDQTTDGAKRREERIKVRKDFIYKMASMRKTEKQNFTRHAARFAGYKSFSCQIT
jgi:hypothetical protein